MASPGCVRAAVVALAAASVACGGSTSADSGKQAEAAAGGGSEDSAVARDSGETDDSGTGSGSERPEAPEVDSVDAWCSTYSSGDVRMVWTVLAQATDPQGADTLEMIVEDGVVVSVGADEVGRFVLSCTADGLSSAACSGTFSGDAPGLGCDGASGVSVVVEVVDEDGHRTASAPVQGRAE